MIQNGGFLKWGIPKLSKHHHGWKRETHYFGMLWDTPGKRFNSFIMTPPMGSHWVWFIDVLFPGWSITLINNLVRCRPHLSPSFVEVNTLTRQLRTARQMDAKCTLVTRGFWLSHCFKTSPQDDTGHDGNEMVLAMAIKDMGFVQLFPTQYIDSGLPQAILSEL
jgi:hypothetical protein